VDTIRGTPNAGEPLGLLGAPPLPVDLVVKLSQPAVQVLELLLPRFELPLELADLLEPNPLPFLHPAPPPPLDGAPR
jgi:hypothetical protein